MNKVDQKDELTDEVVPLQVYAKACKENSILLAIHVETFIALLISSAFNLLLLVLYIMK